MVMSNLIEIKNLSYFVKKKKIVDNANLKIKKYDKITIIGSNGCGKTTLLSLIIGDISPSEGRVSFCDSDLIKRKDIEVLYDNVKPHDMLTVNETIQLFCVLNHINHKDIVTQYYSMFKIQKISNSLIRELSAGEKQRICLLLSVLRPVKFLVLDEPFANIDPVMAEILWSAINVENRTIIFSSHNWKAMEHMNTKVVFMHSGKLINEPKYIEQILDEMPSKMILTFEENHISLNLTGFRFYKHENFVNLFYDKSCDSVNICSMLTQKGINFVFRKVEIRDAYLYSVYSSELKNII